MAGPLNYDGARFLFHGLSDAGHGLAGGLAQIGEHIQKQKDEEKRRSREFKALAEYADASGIMGKDQATVLGLDELKGHVEGTIAKKTMEEQSAKRALAMSQIATAIQQDQEQMATGRDFTALAQMAPEAMAEVRPPLRNARPARGIADVLPELLRQNPRAAQHNNFNEFVRTLQPPQGASGWGLAPGQTIDYGGGRIGRSTSPNSLQFDPAAPEKPEKPTAGNYPWLLSDDEAEFKAGVRSIKDPAERDLALTARSQFMRALGKEDPMAAVLAAILNGGKPPEKKAAETPAGAQYKWVPGQGLVPKK